MNKQSLRSFAFGIFMTVCIIGFVSLFQKESQQSINPKDAKALLEESGYVIIPAAEYNELQNKANAKTNEEEMTAR